MDTTNDGAAYRQLGQDAAGQLEVLDRSRYFLNFVVAGVLLQVQYLNEQRGALLSPDSACSNNGARTQIAASLLILYALFGFYQQSAELAGEGGSQLDVLLNAIVIVVALIRLGRLVRGSRVPTESEELDIPQL